jgi:hypothetical protein
LQPPVSVAMADSESYEGRPRRTRTW